MTDGKMETLAIEKAMRTLSTSVLSQGQDLKKKVYPTNFVEPEWNDSSEVDTPMSSTFVTMEDEENEHELVEALVAQGDPDAIQVQSFEQDLADMFQDVPELHMCTHFIPGGEIQVDREKEIQRILAFQRKREGFWKAFWTKERRI